MNQSLYKLRSLYIAPLVIFTIFEFTPFFFCSGQYVQAITLPNDNQQQHAPSRPSSKGNTHSGGDDPQALQLHKLVVLTLTSDYVVTQTATSYSYSSSTTTVSNLSPTPTGHSNNPSSTYSTSSSISTDTAVLVGSLVGGLCGLFLIGIGLFLIFRKRNSKADLPASSSSFYENEQGDYGGRGSGRGFNRNSHVRAFVPPLLYDQSLSTPTNSIEASSSQQQQQHHQLHGHPYNISDPLIQAYYQQEDTITNNTITTTDNINNDRHVPNESHQVAGSERHVPHLVD